MVKKISDIQNNLDWLFKSNKDKNDFIDGRNRYLACKMFNIIPIFEELKEGIDPLTFIISKNLHRRHLNTAQKCEIALKLLKIERKKAKVR